MSKPQTAALGFRIKSGWAAVALLTGGVDSPQLCDVRPIQLSDARLPETRQPYHAAMGKLETDLKKVNQRVRVVRCIAQQSIAILLAGYRQKGYGIRRATLVVGSQIDPATVANPHIRAHAFGGQLFRAVVEDALQAKCIRTCILLERGALATAAAKLRKPNDVVRRTIQGFSSYTHGPWRADQKLAALGAWLGLSG
jgi:hypothetical protein